MLDGQLGEKVPEGVAKAVIEYAQLATALGEPMPQLSTSKRRLLQPLQHHANAVGALLGRIQAGASISEGEVAHAARALLAYLEQASPGAPDEFYGMQQIAVAAPVLGRAFLRAAALSGETEFARVVAEMDDSFDRAGSKNGKRIDLRRQLAAEVYRWDGDVVGACRRLDSLIPRLQEETPDRQVEMLAELAATFALVGSETRARQLLSQIHTESLGYAVAAKKDPQYAFWRELFELANGVDPARRAERVTVMMRQIHGMTRTEGRDSAYRIAAAVLTEAAMVSAAMGLAVGRAMAEWGVLSWGGIVSALVIGVVRRRPNVGSACAVVWGSLALPYYSEPRYGGRELGEPISVCVGAASNEDLPRVVELLRLSIEAEGRLPIRAKLLEELHAAAAKRGLTVAELDGALNRWRAEAPVERDTGTPERYEEVASLSELEQRIRQEAMEEVDYLAAAAYRRLIDTATFDEAYQMFGRWPAIQRDARARFELFDRAIANGEARLARGLVDGYLRQIDEQATWSYWTGAGKLKYFQARAKLDGEGGHKDAYSDFVGELAAGREYTGSLLADVKDVFQTITAEPDWPAMWDAIAEQLATTREHGIGRKFEVSTDPTADEGVIVALYRWALSLSLFELTMHVRVGALRLLSVEGGATVFNQLIHQLIEGEADDPVEALQLLSLDLSDAGTADLRGAISTLVDHPDYAVAAMAARVCERWDCKTSAITAELPAFYSIQLEEGGEDFDPPSLVDPRTGAMLVEDPFGWTFAFPSLVKSLARKGPSIKHIRHRCGMLISEWGGLSAFGQSATEALEATLAQIDMRMTYMRPHMAVAARALRYVAGEMRKAQLLGMRDEPWLLEMMGYPAVRLALLSPAVRPRFLTRPPLDRIGWSKDEEQRWIADVRDDVNPMVIGRDTILAEITRFRGRNIRRKCTADRIRVPFFDAKPREDLSSWIAGLPRAIWVEGIVPLSDEPAATIVRRFSQVDMPEIPRDMLVICPLWSRRLGWRRHPLSWLVYVDALGRVVANIVWWRDGSPGDLQEDIQWGEGVLVIVTPDGREQLEAAVGPLHLQVGARRTISPQPGDGETTPRSATATANE